MRAVVQIGHYPEEGATYEVEHIRYVEPHVTAALRAAGIAVDVYGASLPYGLQHDCAVFLHCDWAGASSSGFSIGFWEELHPGSAAYAQSIRAAYRQASGLPFIGWNITANEAHYYGNRRFCTPTKCALIELGFVSNPAERAFLKANAPALGTAIAHGMLAYFGQEVKEVERWSNRQSWIRVVLVETHAYIGKLEGQGSIEDAWLQITPFDGDTEVIVQAITDNDVKTGTYQVKANKTQEVAASGFGLTGSVCLRVSAKKPVTVTVDRRGWI